jgi:hypothetical protein
MSTIIVRSTSRGHVGGRVCVCYVNIFFVRHFPFLYCANSIFMPGVNGLPVSKVFSLHVIRSRHRRSISLPIPLHTVLL